MTPIKNSSQNFIYNDGKETLISKKTHYVSLAPYRILNNSTANTSYVVFVQNLGNTPITVSSDSVKVSLQEKSTKGETEERKIPVLSYTELMLEIEQQEEKQRRAAAWAAVAGAINASTAAYSTSTTYSSGNAYGSYSGNSYGNYGYTPYSATTYGNYSGSYSGISTTTTYDPAKAQALANQNSQNFRNNLDSIAANAQSSRQLIEQLVMKAQTISPGQGHGGLVVTDTRQLNHRIEGDFEVVVSVADEQHIFTVNRALYVNK